MSDTDEFAEGRLCSECKHYIYLHGTSKGCTKIVAHSIQQATYCGCREPKRVWIAKENRWVTV